MAVDLSPNVSSISAQVESDARQYGVQRMTVHGIASKGALRERDDVDEEEICQGTKTGDPQGYVLKITSGAFLRS